MIVFDKDAKTYDDWYLTAKGKLMDDLQTKLILGDIEIQKGMKVLDIGCGTGNYSVKLAQLGCDVTALDVSQEMLKIAKEKSEKLDLDIDFRIMDSSDLDFKTESFDIVVSVTAVEFIENLDKSIEEMFRVARSGAPIVIGTLHKESAWGKLYESEEVTENSVFKYANLKTKKDIEAWNPGRLVNIKQCLFIEPLAGDEDFSIDREIELSKVNNGGFIRGLWKKIMTCEFSFIPIQSNDYANDVNRVLRIIESSGLEYSVNEISTIVKGDSLKVFTLIQKIYEDMHDDTKFTIAAKFSNVCGCEI